MKKLKKFVSTKTGKTIIYATVPLWIIPFILFGGLYIIFYRVPDILIETIIDG